MKPGHNRRVLEVLDRLPLPGPPPTDDTPSRCITLLETISIYFVGALSGWLLYALTDALLAGRLP